MKGFGILYKKMRRYFQKKYFSNILEQILEKLRISTEMPAPPLLTVE